MDTLKDSDPLEVEKELLSASYIRTTNTDQRELLKRLTILSHFLGQYEDEDHSKIAEIAAALIQNAIIQHKNGDIRLMAAICLAEVFRIYVPDMPYECEVLKKICKLFLDQLSGLGSASASKYLIHLLERIAVVRTFVCFLDFDKLVVKLFQMVFQIISSVRSKMVVIHLLDILVSCIEEADHISQEILDIVLGNLIEIESDDEPTSTPKNHSSKLLAEKLIVTTEKYLKDPIEKMLCDIIAGKGCSSEIKDRYHDIIYELYFIAPSILQAVLPQLTIEIGCEDTTMRKNAIHLLAKIFSAKGDASQTHFQLFNTLMKRFLDIDPDIRILMINFGKHFLMHNKDPDGIASVNKELENRLRDKDEKVRDVAVVAVCEAAIEPESAEHIGVGIYEELVLRLRDRKNTIRRNAMLGMSKVYKYTQEKIHNLTIKKSKDMSGKKMLEMRNEAKKWKEKSKVLSQIYSKIMQCYFLPDMEDKIRVETILSTEILNKGTSAQTRERFIHFVSSLDDNALLAFSRLLDDKKSLRDDVSSWLNARQNHEQDRMNKKASTIVFKLTGGTAMDKWKKFSSLNDETLFRSLITMVDPKSTLKQMDTAYKTIKRRYGSEKTKNTPVKEFIKLIVDKLSFRFMDESIVHSVVERLIEHDESEEEQSEEEEESELDRKRLLDILYSLSLCIPSSFLTSLSLMESLLDLEDQEEKGKAVQIVYNLMKADKTPFTDLIEIREALVKICRQGTKEQANYAMKSFIYCCEEPSALKKLTTQLVNDAVSSSSVSALVALCQLCKHDIKLLGKHEAKLVRQVKLWCTDAVETRSPSKRTPKKSPMKRSPSKRKGLEEDGLACVAIEFLGHYILAHPNPSEVSELKTILFKCLEDALETKRASSAVTVLRLASNRKHDSSLPLDTFLKLAYLAIDPSDLVKHRFHDKLYKCLRKVNVPLKFLAILPLFHPTRSYDIRKEVQNCIQIRRKLLKDRTTSIIERSRKGLGQDEDESTRHTTSSLPEYALPYLVYLIAHAEFFSEDGPKYLRTIKYLSLFLGELLHGSDNYVFLKQLLQDMKQTEDARDASYRGVHTVTDICRLIVQQKHARATTIDFTKVVHPGIIFLPSELFRVHEEGDEEKTLLPANESYLPSDFKLPDHDQTSRMLIQEEKPATPKKRKRGKVNESPKRNVKKMK